MQENNRRLAELHSPYNPFTGEGSPIGRFPFKVNTGTTIYLPDSMKELDWVKRIEKSYSLEYNIRRQYPETYPEIFMLVLSEITGERIKHDFEFWAFTCVKIQDKVTKELTPFKLNRAQRKLLGRIMKMFNAGVPIRIILLKARQWGGSTLTQLFMAWVQMFHKTRWHSAIVTDVEEQARNIRGMFALMANNHPKGVYDVVLRPHQGSSKNKELADRDCAIAIGSMQQPDNLRSFDFAMCHLSEVGLWKKTKGKEPKDLVQAIRSTIPSAPMTMVVMESTAKGVGNFFHREWLAASDGLSGYDPVFVAWFEIEMYQLKIKDYITFIDRMTEYDWFQFECGATLEGINWYKTHKKAENMDTWRMQSEFPTTPDEAFQTTGRRAFAPLYVKQARVFNRKPDFVGDITADEKSGKGAFDNIRFDAYENGNLSVWDMPDKTRNVKNRYITVVDIGGRTKEADYSIIRVIDRFPMLEGGVPEAILTWKGHLDQDLVVWKAAQIAKAYNDSILVVEANSLKSKTDETEGEHIITVLDEIKPYYSNLYSRTDPEKVRQGAPVKYGFHTNVKTKTNIIDNLNKILREGGYIEYDARVCDEYDCYEMKPDGTYGAVEGQHDDLVMSTAIGLKVNDIIDFPFIVMPKEKVQQNRKITEASF